MDAKELMIGDWVFDTIRQKSVRVDCLSYAGIRGEKDVVYYRDDVYEPIPLVPEILEKNGFIEDDKDCYRLDINDGVYINADFKADEPWVSIHNRCYFAVPICLYVHQLQHALRLCGIDQKITL